MFATTLTHVNDISGKLPVQKHAFQLEPHSVFLHGHYLPTSGMRQHARIHASIGYQHNTARSCQQEHSLQNTVATRLSTF
jgi:hypothetical protein